MNYLEFNISNNGGLSCEMISSKNVKKTFFSHRTNIILDNMESELYKEQFKLKYEKGAITLKTKNSTLVFNDYKEMRSILKKHVPRLVKSFDVCVERTRQKKIKKVRKTTLRTVALVGIMTIGLNTAQAHLGNDSDLRVVNAGSVETYDDYSADYTVDVEAIEDGRFNASETHEVDEQISLASAEPEEYKSVEPAVDEEHVDIEDNEIIEEAPIVEEVKEEALPTLGCEININCAENSQETDVIEVQDNYRDIASKIGSKWGVSENLILGMLTQESHGAHTNLMQIQPWSVADEVMNIYNFETGTYQKLVVTENPGKYASDVITITREDLNNPFTNISIATALYRHILNVYSNNNPIAAIEIYNKGIGNFNKIIRKASNVTGLSSDQLLNDLENTEYLNYSYVCGQGDPNYVANIMQYVDGDITIKMVNEDGQEYQVTYNVNKTQEKELNR